MASKILRQAIAISFRDIEKLTRDWIETMQIALDNNVDFDRKVLFSIINKTPECSDTWEFESEDEKTENSHDE